MKIKDFEQGAADDSGAPDAKGKPTPYGQWKAVEGIPVYPGYYFEDLRDVELAPWARTGGLGCFINHQASDESNDCHLCEIPPGGSLNLERHLYEEMIYVLSGNGSTTVHAADGHQQSFEWQAGSLFAIPLNAPHQHFNGSGSEPARFIAVTNLPSVINLFNSPPFVYECDYPFANRFDNEDNYFSADGELVGRYLWRTNFVPNASSIEIYEYSERGAGAKVELSLARNTMGAHISGFPVGTYKMAHKHGPGAHIIIVSGEGYSLMWRPGEEPKRYDWDYGSLVIPPDGWFHQHFNTGPDTARYLALSYRARRPRNEEGIPLSRLSTRLGGDQIEYQDEDPIVLEMYRSALAERGVEFNMDLSLWQG